ncbi:lipoate--protein ligase family protein [Thermodesulfovibrionales bacterium]|nr:lipoate--protein ligase family protein [Thermodesulfovibrionales bacterium]MCL0086158.1 lipoate--protein ligase family protein [Thermodesulfovibrionales bacterium]
MNWRLIDSGLGDAAYNMAMDEAIAINVRKRKSPPTLRLYGWRVLSVSIGSFQKITDINIEHCRSNNIPVVRRPTGGRGILHGDELTYSFSSRKEGLFSGGLMDTYRQIGIALKSGLEIIGVAAAIEIERKSGRDLMRSPLCIKSRSYGEISFSNQKLIGSAQRRWEDGFLQQGSIPYSIDSEKLTAIFRLQNAEAEKTKVGGLRKLLPGFKFEEFKQSLKLSFEETFGITFVCSQPSPDEEVLAHLLLSEKYLDPQWTERMAKKI